MLLELGVYGAIVGHSERRQLFGETDEASRARARGARGGLCVIACVGETEAEREAGRDRGRAPPPGRRVLEARRAARPRLRARLGDRHRQDRDARAGAGGARVHQVGCSTCRSSTAARSSPTTPPSCSPSRTSTARSSAAPPSTSSRSPRFAEAGCPLVALVILDGWGCAPPGPGNAVELADTPVFDRLWAEYPHTTLEASGEAVGLPPGQMGNSEVGHLTIGSGRVLYQDLMRVNKAIEDGSFFENPALRGAFERGDATSTCSGSSPTAASTRTSTTCRRCSASRRRRPGSTRSPTAATSRRTRPCTTSPSCPPTGSRPSPAATTRWTATSAGSAPTARLRRDRRGRSPTQGQTLSTSCKQQLRRGGHGRVRRAGRTSRAGRGSSPATRAIFFNFRPDRARQLSQRLLEAGLRPDDDDALPRRSRLPGRLRGAGRSRARWRRCSPRTALRQLHCAETEKYAHVTYFFNGGREEAWPGEDADPRPVAARGRHATTTSRRCPRPRWPTRFAAEIGDGYRSGSSTSPTRTWSGTPASIPAVVAAVETADRCLGRVLDAVDARRRRRARHRRPRQRRDDARGRTASARTPRTRPTRSR